MEKERIAQDVLKLSLDMHHAWIKSLGRTGVRLVIVDKVILGDDLTGANLRYADLYNSIIISADMTGVDMRDALLIGTELGAASLDGALFDVAALSYATFEGVHVDV